MDKLTVWRLGDAVTCRAYDLRKRATLLRTLPEGISLAEKEEERAQKLEDDWQELVRPLIALLEACEYDIARLEEFRTLFVDMIDQEAS